jgi:polyribonucleotide nucleotidyltransferase
MAEKKFKIPKSAFMNILHLFARATPFFPDTYILSVIIKDLKKARSSMDEKIFIAHTSLQETSELIKELEKNLKERTEKLDKLKVDFEKYSKLAELEEEKVKPLIKQLESSQHLFFPQQLQRRLWQLHLPL